MSSIATPGTTRRHSTIRHFNALHMGGNGHEEVAENTSTRARDTFSIVFAV